MYEGGAGQALRQLLSRPQIARAVGAHDAIGVTLAAEAGFDAIWASGLEISTSRGVPDANVLSMTECLDAASVMVRASPLPVLVDCDTGFGDVINVMHLVREAEQRGIAGICIEDKPFPKINSFVPAEQRLESVSSFCMKVRAARDARRNPDLVIIARLEALIVGAGMDEALRRGECYEASGADVLLIHSRATSSHEVTEFCARYSGKLPVIVIPTRYPQATCDDLAEAGAAMTIYANQGLRSAVRAVREAFRSIIEHGRSLEIEERLSSVDEILALTNMDGWLGRQKSYERWAQEEAWEAPCRD
jgi:phosphoenolpyruvate phosphomutase